MLSRLASYRTARRTAGGPALAAIHELVLNINHFVMLDHARLDEIAGRLDRLAAQVGDMAGRLEQDGTLRDEVVAGRTAELEALALVSRSLNDLGQQVRGGSHGVTP